MSAPDRPCADVLAWARAGVGRYDIVNRYSRQHVVADGATRALCGALPRWEHVTAGDTRRCERCFKLAAARGYVDEYGDPVAERERA